MGKNDVKLMEIAKKLQGLQTVSTISKKLNVKRSTAINYAWKLRKKNYLTTEYARNKVRWYSITPLKFRKREGYSLYDLVNKYSRIKLSTTEDYIIHSKKEPLPEEILIKTMTLKKFRLMLASLDLFNKINDWSKLRKLAEKQNIERNVGALYDVARNFIKVKKMDKRTRNAMLRGSGKKFLFDYEIKSKNFKEIEKKWRVFIPLNKADMEIFEEWST